MDCRGSRVVIVNESHICALLMVDTLVRTKKDATPDSSTTQGEFTSQRIKDACINRDCKIAPIWNIAAAIIAAQTSTYSADTNTMAAMTTY